MTTTTAEPTVSPTRDTDLCSAVRAWARLTPDAPACTVLRYPAGGVTSTTLTYAELDSQARALAARLQAVGAPGDRVALLLPHGLEYVVGFLGSLYSGRWAVPLYAPDARRANDRLVAVLDDADPVAVLASPGRESTVRELLADEGRAADVLIVDGSGDAEAWQEAAVDPDAPAYLQYTSGSTRSPAGVRVSTANLATGMAQLRAALDVGGPGPLVSWLPFFHDMGLVFTLSTPLQAGGHGIYLDPMAFVQQPVRWLRALSTYRADLSVTPNFGLDAAVHRVKEEDREDLDLSNLRVLANGSEPIRAASVSTFSATYEACGFRSTAHSPGYGLAETTLMVTVLPAEAEMTVLDVDRRQLEAGRAVPVEESPDATRLVGCGPAWEQEVRIVDATTRTELEDGGVGEIWVRGANVCDGYHRKPELSAEAFEASAHLLDGTTQDSFLRTGDLGFLLDGQLFVTGRSKDLVIVGGRNHHPADVEATVADTVPESRVGHTAAFAADTGSGEGLVVVVEIEARQAPRLDAQLTRRRVRAALSQVHQLDAHEVVLARAGSIPKTTSGKLQRRACHDRWIAGEIKTVG